MWHFLVKVMGFSSFMNTPCISMRINLDLIWDASTCNGSKMLMSLNRRGSHWRVTSQDSTLSGSQYPRSISHGRHTVLCSLWGALIPLRHWRCYQASVRYSSRTALAQTPVAFQKGFNCLCPLASNRTVQDRWLFPSRVQSFPAWINSGIKWGKRGKLWVCSRGILFYTATTRRLGTLMNNELGNYILVSLFLVIIYLVFCMLSLC